MVSFKENVNLALEHKQKKYEDLKGWQETLLDNEYTLLSLFVQ